MAAPFIEAWLVNGEEDNAPGPPARIIEEISMAGATPKNTPARGRSSKRPSRENPVSLMGWFITAVVPLLTAALVTWLDGKNPKFWKKLKAQHRGMILMLIAAGAHYLEQMGKPKSAGKAAEFDKEYGLAMHDLGVACTALAGRYFLEARAKKQDEPKTNPSGADRKPDDEAPAGMDDRVQRMVENQLRQVVAQVMTQQQQGADLAGLNMIRQPGLQDDLFSPDVLGALENLGRMAA